jgi:hypothetical protein
MSKVTIIKNLISEEKATYFNSKSIEFNLATYILSLESNEIEHRLNQDARDRVFLEIKRIPSKTGKEVWCSYECDLIAYEEGTY